MHMGGQCYHGGYQVEFSLLPYIYYLALSCCLIAASDAGTGLLEGSREESLLIAVLLHVGGREESLEAVLLLASEGEESLVAVFLFVGGREESIGAAAFLSLSPRSFNLDCRKVDSCRPGWRERAGIPDNSGHNCPLVSNVCDSLDFDQHLRLGKRGLDGGSGGRIYRENLGEFLVHDLEIVHVFQIDVAFEDIIQAGAGLLQSGDYVV